MPSQPQHLQKAQSNEGFINSSGLLDPSTHLDWVVTAIFYTALHYVDSHLAKNGIHPKSHVKRDEAIKNDPNLIPIWNAYMKLKDESIKARYDFVTFGPQYVKDLIDIELQTIKQHILGLP